ncbi:hypothetical protein GGR56DRAFT_624329 [Xylariaceae sp. FL0804]|nr:hypothetical protein GGR56DRAFT_624329 [Xylariaceae sp. FL0804]
MLYELLPRSALAVSTLLVVSFVASWASPAPAAQRAHLWGAEDRLIPAAADAVAQPHERARTSRCSGTGATRTRGRRRRAQAVPGPRPCSSTISKCCQGRSPGAASQAPTTSPPTFASHTIFKHLPLLPDAGLSHLGSRSPQLPVSLLTRRSSDIGGFCVTSLTDRLLR